MISDEEAIEIARVECERRDRSFTPPIGVSRGLLGLGWRITVYTNDGQPGGSTFVRIHPRSGRVTSFVHFTR